MTEILAGVFLFALGWVMGRRSAIREMALESLKNPEALVALAKRAVKARSKWRVL